jgi:hypothetical protein
MVGMATVVVLPVSAVSYGGGSVQGYGADTLLDTGTIVQLTGKDSNRVKIATQSELQNMFGVTVDRNQLPVMLSNEALKNEVFVAVSGTYNVLVSTQGGSITSGDYVTLSSVNGVAMKAGTEEKTVFGRANASFDGKGVSLGTTNLKDTTGKANRTVSLGQIPVTIDIKSIQIGRKVLMKKVSRSVDDYLESLPDELASDMQQLDVNITKHMKDSERILWQGVFWGGSDQAIIGYGDYTYQRPGKEVVEWFSVGLARQKNYYSIYINAAEDGQYILKKYADKLGKVKVGSGSLSFTQLEDVNMDELMKLVDIARDQLAENTTT